MDVFECKACGKAFAVTKKIDPKVCEHKNLASLGESMALSTGERDEVFECIHCGRTFQIK